MRWAEQAAFSPLMRTHEGNRPRDNWQFDGDRETLDHLARMTRIHVQLKDYLKAAVRENALHGKPVMAPLFLRFEDDPLAWDLKGQYLLGPDLLVAPVLREGETTVALFPKQRAYRPRGTGSFDRKGSLSWNSGEKLLDPLRLRGHPLARTRFL